MTRTAAAVARALPASQIQATATAVAMMIVLLAWPLVMFKCAGIF